MFTFLLDDVGIPLNYRHMEGFGVHTYTLMTRDGKVRERERDVLCVCLFVSIESKNSRHTPFPPPPLRPPTSSSTGSPSAASSACWTTRRSASAAPTTRTRRRTCLSRSPRATTPSGPSSSRPWTRPPRTRTSSTPWTSPSCGRRTGSRCSRWGAWCSTRTPTTFSRRTRCWPFAPPSSCPASGTRTTSCCRRASSRTRTRR